MTANCSTADYGYIFCPKFEHLKSTAVCINRCKHYHRKLCIAVEKAYLGFGYVSDRLLKKKKGVRL